jgi:hypothetical protein
MSTTSRRGALRPPATPRLLRTGGLAGMLMLPTFAGVVLVLSWAEWDFLHGLGFGLLMVGNLVAFVAGGLALRGAPGWARHWVYSVLNAPAAVLVTIAFAPLDQVSFYVLLVVLLAWYAVLGQRMHRLAVA